MWTFLKLLFLYKVTTLSSAPTLISDELVFTPKHPVHAITNGANLKITLQNSDSAKKIWLSVPSGMPAKHNDSLVVVTLYATDGSVAELSRLGKWTSNDERGILVSSYDGVPVGPKFERIVIKTREPIYASHIVWANGRH